MTTRRDQNGERAPTVGPVPLSVSDGAGARRHLLTVLHSAERTGPPLLALRFLRWLRHERPDWTLSTLSLGGGTELLPEFSELGPILVGQPVDPAGSLQHRCRAVWENRRLRRRIEHLGALDLVHVHCAGSMRVLDVTPPVPVVCHLHELAVGLDLHLRSRAAVHLRAADRYVAVSDAVRDEFLGRFDVDPGRVERQWGFVDAADLPAEVDRSRIGIPDDSFLVVTSGVRHWRKAPELFVRIAAASRRARPDLPWRFVWVGGQDDGRLQQLVAAAGLSDLVHFLDHRRDALDWVAAADAFLLPAREDAFPLVCVEAAALGRPIVTFDSGGATELVAAADCGVVVPFPDVEAAARTLADLADDPARRALLGAGGHDFARSHLGTAVAGPALLELFERTMGPR